MNIELGSKQETAIPGHSVITIPMEELQEIINAKAGTGEILFKKGTYEWNGQEIIDAGKEIGYTIIKLLPAKAGRFRMLLKQPKAAKW